MFRGTWRLIVFKVRWEMRATCEHLLFWIGRHMPRSVRYYATVVSCAEATTGQYGATIPDELSVMQMLKRVGDKGGR